MSDRTTATAAIGGGGKRVSPWLPPPPGLLGVVGAAPAPVPLRVGAVRRLLGVGGLGGTFFSFQTGPPEMVGAKK